MPTISVIVPVYKVEKYIHRCVDSILGQTYEDFELILVDDGSPDNCGAICDEYAAKDSRVVVIHQENGGLSAARNAGIDWAFANSDSQWLTFIDSDDWVHPEYLQRLLDASVTMRTNISACRIESKDDQCDEDAWYPLKYLTEDAYCSDNTAVFMISACAKLFRKHLWEQIRFPKGKLHEDRFTTHKVLFQCRTVALIQAPMYRYCRNPNSIMRAPWSPRRLDDLEAIDEQCSFFADHGFVAARKKTMLSSLYVVCSMMQEIENKESLSSEDKRSKVFLQKKLQEYIRQCKQLGNISIDNYWYAFERAFPLEVRVYEIAQIILRKLGVKK